MRSILVALAVLPLAFAAPGKGVLTSLSKASLGPLSNVARCPIDSATLSFPVDQTALSVPANQSPIAITLGIGVQNYTCASGNYTSAGAVAKLFDISCLYGTREFATIQDDIYKLPLAIRNAIVQIASNTPLLLANHYFITNPVTGTGISPKFAQQANGGISFTVLAKAAGIKAPVDPVKTVDWLQLSSIAGDWAKTVFRVDTVAGQPPASCVNGSAPISVPYVAKYWFFK